jgi:hypothetical protein
MTEEPHNMILDQLRAIRGSQERTEHDIKDLKFRVGQIEQTLAQHGTTLAHYPSRFDRIDARLDSIEKRLGLVDAYWQERNSLFRSRLHSFPQIH